MRVKELEDKIIGIVYGFANEEQCIKIYTDYRDRNLSTYTLEQIFDDNNPREIFNEILSEWAFDATPYEEEMLEIEIKDLLTEEEKNLCDENREEIWNRIRDEVSFCYDPEEFNMDLKVNIMVDCGNGDYDYSCDNVLNYCGNGKFDEHSSMLWLANTQGKAELLKQCCEQQCNTNDTFINSCIQELENLSSHMGTITFLVKMSLFQVFDLIELSQKEKSKSYMVLGKETTCGLYDSWNGGGSVLEIELDKDVKLPIKYAEICVEGCRMRGYDVNEVYGLVDGCWEYSLKDVVEMEK